MITSFGYKNGIPPTRATKVFDVQDLSHNEQDPSWEIEKQKILNYCLEHPGVDIGIGCEKGQHRSVKLANDISRIVRTSVYHRDK